MKISEWSERELSAWIAEKNEPKLPDDHHGIWHPRPYTDPEICLRLLKENLQHGFRIRRTETNEILFIRIEDHGLHKGSACQTLERVVAEAWALAHGIEAELG